MRVLALRPILWFYFNFISMCVYFAVLLLLSSYFAYMYLSFWCKSKIGARPVDSVSMQYSPLLVWFIFFHIKFYGFDLSFVCVCIQ